MAKSLKSFKISVLNQHFDEIKYQNETSKTHHLRVLFSAISLATLSIVCTIPLSVAHAATTNTVAAPLDHVVAVVDDSVLLASEVGRSIYDTKQQFLARKQTPPSDEVLQNDVIRQLILRKIQLGIIARSGANVDENTLNSAIASIAQQQGAPSLSAFQAKLDSIKPNGYAEFRQQIQDDLNINRLQQNRVSSRIKITDQDIDNFLSSPQSVEALKTEFNFTVLQAPFSDEKNAAEVAKANATAAEALKQLQAGKSIETVVNSLQLRGGNQGWRKSDELPTPFVEALTSLKRGEFSKPFMTSDGVDFLQLNDERGAAGAKVHQYHVRHILAKTSEVVSVDEAKLKIDDIYAKLKAGASFEDMAKAYSDDPGSAQNGGDLNWVSTGEMVPAFEKVMLQTPEGQLSAPFQSNFGWHILQVEASRDQDMTQQYRREVAKKTLYDRQYPVELDNWLREIRAAAYVDIRDGSTSR